MDQDSKSSLSPSDFQRLYISYQYARAWWRNIGAALGISSDDLAAIEADHHKDCAQCFQVVLTKWLRQEGIKTESELSDAVAKAKRIINHMYPIAVHVLVIIIIMLLLVITVALLITYSGYHHYYKSVEKIDHLIGAANTLKERYNHQTLVEFTLLDNTNEIPFLDIAVLDHQDKNKTIESWEFLSNIDKEYKKASQTNNESLRILISGHPGTGKTTLMRHIAKEWAKGRVLQACEILFLISLDRLSTDQKPQSLLELLKLSPLQFPHYVEEIFKEIQARRGAGVCFLLDSFDEWAHKDDFVHHLFFDSVLHLSLCIATSRQIHMLRKQSNIRFVEIMGFYERHLHRHLHDLSSDQRVTNSIETLWIVDRDIKDMCRLPLHMVMLIYIIEYKENHNISIHTKTQIYSAFMNVMIQHYSKHLSDWNTVSVDDCISKNSESIREDKFCIAFQHLHSVAFDMLINKRSKFRKRVEINRNINSFGFVKVTKLRSIWDEVTYTFYHPTFVEFFAAIHLLSLPHEERLYLYIKNQQRERQVNHNLWLFFIGLVSEYDADNLLVVIRQFAMYHGEQEIKRFPPYCQNRNVLEYVNEIQWKEKALSRSSAGIVVNSTLFILRHDDKHYPSFNTLVQTMLNNNIRTLKVDNINYTQADLLQTLLRFNYDPLDKTTKPTVSKRRKFSNYIYMTLQNQKLGDKINSHNTEVDYIQSSIQLLLQTITQVLSPKEVQNTKYLVAAYVIQLWGSLKDHVSRLENLHLNNIELSCGDFPKLINVLKFNKDITYIFDLKIDLVSKTCRELVSSLTYYVLIGDNIKLQSLTMIFPKEYFFIPYQLQATGLTLSISIPYRLYEPQKKSHCSELVGEISGFKELVTLKIQGCPLLNHCNQKLTSLPCNLQELTLGRSSLSDDNGSALVELIHSTQLTSLSLPSNSLTGDGLYMLVKELNYHKELTSLDFSSNPVTEKNGLETLSQLSNLRELKLSNCSIGDAEIEVLVSSLESNSSLHSLNLSGNPFIGSEHGLEPLARLTNLRYLDISGWQHRHGHCHDIQTGGCDNHTLIKVLKKLTQLHFFKLCSKNDPPIYWSKEMASVISQLPHLQVFNAPCLQVLDD